MTNLTDHPANAGKFSGNNAVRSSHLTAKKVTGVVKFYSVQKCYGFIKRDDTKDYVFVHSTSIMGKNQRRVTRSLDKGERVEFEVVMSKRSPEAINVTGPNGEPVLGSEYALVTMQWHQYNEYKQYLMKEGERAARDHSPRARRFFRRRQSQDGANGNHENRNERENQRGRGRRQRKQHNTASLNAIATGSEQSAQAKDGGEGRINKKNKAPKRRGGRRNRGRKTRKDADANGDTSRPNDRKGSTSRLSKSKKTATPDTCSSESLDFEKINSEETNANSGSNNASADAGSSASSSRLAASFNNGNQ